MGWDKYTDWDAGKDKKTVPIPKEEADKIRDIIRKNQKKFKASNRQPLMIADHGKYYNEYGQPIQNPAFGIDRGGNPVNLPHMEQTPEEKIRNEELHKLKYHSNKKLGSNWSKRLLKAQGGRGHTTVGDKLYLDPVKQKLIPLPIDLESDKDKEIRHNQRYGFG